MKIIGLTGGIASGKSTVSLYLKKLGAVIIDADILARTVVQPEEKAYTEIVKVYGEDILTEDKSIDRKKLASKVFGNEKALQKLNSIIHPEVIAETKLRLKEADRSGAKIAVVDAPLLIEAGMASLADEVWVVSVSEEEQIKRAALRDNASREEIERRIAAQMPLKDKRQFATRVIDNSGSLENTYAQVDIYFSQLISE